MVSNFLRRYKLKGMKRSTVLRLLGEPNMSAEDDNKVKFGGFDWNIGYAVGPAGSEDSKGLLVGFDKNYRVNMFEVRKFQIIYCTREVREK